MYFKKTLLVIALSFFSLAGLANTPVNKAGTQEKGKTVTLSVANKKLSLLIDYSACCIVKQMWVNGVQTLSPAGAYTGIISNGGTFRSTSAGNSVKLTRKRNGIVLSNIKYGDKTIKVNETWNFTITGNRINWTISRIYDNEAQLQETAFPQWNSAA